MTRKIIIAIISFLVFAVVLSGVVWAVAQRAKKQEQSWEQSTEQTIQHQSQDEKDEKSEWLIDETQDAQLEEIKPIDLQTVQPQNEADPSDWLTYVSENKHFTIKYPSGLFIKEPLPVQGDESLVMGRDTALVISDNADAKLQAIDSSEAVHIAISVSKKPEGKTLRELVYELSMGEEDLVSEIIVNGSQGYRVFSEKESVPLIYFFEKDDQIYTLFGFTYLEGEAASEGFKRMEEIYSTFDFL